MLIGITDIHTKHTINVNKYVYFLQLVATNRIGQKLERIS